MACNEISLVTTPLEVVPLVLGSQDCSNSIGARVENAGVYKDLVAVSSVENVKVHDQYLDDVISDKHESVMDSALFRLPNGHSVNVDKSTVNQGNHQKTLDVSVQTQADSGYVEPRLARVIKDCSLTKDQGCKETPIIGNDILSVMCSPLGNSVTVFESCVSGKCTCEYLIGDVPCQLKPCRFAAVIQSNLSWGEEYLELLWNITDGFPLVDAEVPSYRCSNYSSILDPVSKGKMDKIIRNELIENVVSIVDYEPHCVHALGAVPKPNGGIRPITDCSRPTGISVNNYCCSLFKEFSYKSVDNVVEILKWGMYMSVVDIKSAYRAVPIRQEHRKYMGFEWELDGVKKLLVDNRLCFGLRLGPQYFQHISNFIHDILLNVYKIETVNYLDDFITISRSYESCLRAQSCMLKVLRDLGFYVAYDKVSPPSTCTTFLGIEIDSICMELRLPENKIQKLNDHLDAAISANRVSKVEVGIVVTLCSLSKGRTHLLSTVI